MVSRRERERDTQRNEIYFFLFQGMSESTGPETANIPSGWRVGSCGKALPGVEVKIDNPDDSGEGEVCLVVYLISLSIHDCLPLGVHSW